MKITICDITKEIPDQLIEANKIIAPFYEKATTLSREIYINLKKEKDADTFLEKLYETSCDYVDTVVQMAVDYLVKSDIWDYNVDRFNDEYEAERYNINELFEEFYGDEYLDILEEEQKIRNIREIERSSRSNWVGGGFGFSGAVKGAIQAEILNFATDTVRGINDSAVDASDKASISKLKKDLINDKEKLQKYCYMLRIKLQNIGWALYDFLIANGKVEKYSFDINTAYARFDNILVSTLPDTDKASKIVDCILLYPYLYDFYESLYDIDSSKTTYDLAVLFGFSQRIQDKFLSEFWKDYEPMAKMPSASPNQMSKKFVAFVKLMKQYSFMKENGSWDEKFAEDYQLCSLLEQHKNTYSILEKERRTFNNTVYTTVEEAQSEYDEYFENKRAEEERAENIETLKSILKIGIPLAIVGVIIYGIYYIFSESGILGALIDMFNSVGN